MTHLADFCRSGYSFEERIGDPDAFSAAIGRIAICFSQLEEQLSRAIHSLLATDPPTGEIVTSRLSFKGKVDILASLVRSQIGTRRFNTGMIDSEELLDELLERCFRAEELRNRILLRVQTEKLDAAYLLDVADFVCTVASYVEEFFLEAAD
jgi:hypothetical protein